MTMILPITETRTFCSRSPAYICQQNWEFKEGVQNLHTDNLYFLQSNNWQLLENSSLSKLISYLLFALKPEESDFLELYEGHQMLFLQDTYQRLENKSIRHRFATNVKTQ